MTDSSRTTTAVGLEEVETEMAEGIERIGETVVVEVIQTGIELNDQTGQITLGEETVPTAWSASTNCTDRIAQTDPAAVATKTLQTCRQSAEQFHSYASTSSARTENSRNFNRHSVRPEALEGLTDVWLHTGP